MNFLAIALGLFVLSLLVFVIDLMIPSGGVLIALTSILALCSILAAFGHSTTTGIWMVIATFSAIPFMFWAFIVIWPRTPFGKKMIVEPKPAEKFVWSDAAKNTDANTLIGSLGVAVEDMLPSGLVQVGEQTYEAFSETGPIDAGKAVKIIRLDVGRLVVIAVKENPTQQVFSKGTGLDRPAHELNIDSLEG